jgi:hypothetical protein
MDRTVQKLSQISSNRCSASRFWTALRRSSGCRAAKSAPNTASPISVITPARPKDATPGSKECQNTNRGSSMPPVSRHQRPNAFASPVFLRGARSLPRL